MAAVDKTYGDALFSLVTEEDEKALPDILGQLKGVSEVFAAEPDFIKLLRTPTIPIEEKTALVKEVFDGKVHKFVVNFLCILTENDRLPDFERILAYFTGLYNEKLGIADVTVTSAMPLSDTAAEKIRAKMAEITGKTVNMTLKPMISSSAALLSATAIRLSTEASRQGSNSLRLILPELSTDIKIVSR